MLIVVVLVLVGAFSAAFASPANAQTSCGATPTYNPSATLGANPVTVVQGNDTTITGTGFAPNCPLTLTITSPSGAVVATLNLVADSNGAFSTVINTTGYQLGTYTGTAVQGGLTLTTSFTVVAQAVATTVVTTLPTTGSSSTGILVQGGLVLVAVGGLLVLVSRKRRSASAAA